MSCGMKVFASGGVELHVLDDGTWRFPAAAFFADVPEAVWRDELETDAEGKIPVGHNCGLLRVQDELVVIDTGYGDETHGGRTGHMLESLARAGHRPGDVTRVITTHAHGDHIKRNTRLRDRERVPTFPNAQYHLARADHDWFRGPGRVPEFDEQVGTIEDAGMLSLFDDPRVLVLPGVTLLSTPGHTPGHTTVLIEAGRRTALFLGDVCHHPLHFAHPDWVSRFDTHPEATPHTRERLFRLALERDALIVCPHALFPGAGRLVETASGVRWQAEKAS